MTGPQSEMRGIAIAQFLLRHSAGNILLITLITAIATLIDSIGILAFLPLIYKLYEGSEHLNGSGENLQILLNFISDLSIEETLSLIAILFFLKYILLMAVNGYLAYIRPLFLVKLRSRILDVIKLTPYDISVSKPDGYYNSLAIEHAQTTYGSYIAFIRLLSSFTQASVYVGVVVFTDFNIVIAFFLLIGGFSLLIRIINRRVRKLAHRCADIASLFNNRLFEILANSLYLRAIGKISEASQVVLRAATSEADLQFKKNFLNAVSRYTLEPFLVLAFCGYLYLNANEPGVLLSFAGLFILYRGLRAGETIMVYWQRVLEGVGSITLIDAALKSKRHTANDTGGQNIESFSSLVARNLSFSYSTRSSRVLKDINFTFFKNEIVGIFGQSGVGKSTLANILLGVLSPSSGSILINDVDSRSIDSVAWAKLIGFIPQKPYFFSGSIFQNLILDFEGPRAGVSLERIDSLLVQLHLKPFIDSLSGGLNTDLGAISSVVSGGQLQRLAILRELLRDPDILIVDEPSSSLDTRSRDALGNLLTCLSQKCTVVLISHDEALQAICDRALYLDFPISKATATTGDINVDVGR